jgi:hypothetical protein
MNDEPGNVERALACEASVVKAFIMRDIGVLSLLLDPAFTYVHANGGFIETKDDFIDAARAGVRRWHAAQLKHRKIIAKTGFVFSLVDVALTTEYRGRISAVDAILTGTYAVGESVRLVAWHSWH